MKKYLQTLIIVFGILNSNILLTQPKIKIINPNIDFGKVDYIQDAMVTRIFITNEGTDTLRISNVKAECGCTVADLAENKVAPGDTTSIVAKLYLTNLVGQVTKGINVFSNDSLLPHQRINLNVYVFRRFEITPRYLVFDRVRTGNPATAEVIIKNNTDKDAVIKSVSFAKEGFVCNLSENDVLKKNEEFNLKATVIATHPGSIKTDLIIELYHPEEQEIKISIYGNAIAE
ncbi:MAG: DUF1573 domain-containing protein [Bacteroidetes bacterium]|nr:DUF1573 domain-containing protein [Bacteroidota bacterium]